MTRLRTRQRPLDVDTPPRPRVHARALLAEALAGLLQRPGRSVLTMTGTVLGLGSFVAILGLTTTAAAQISSAFTLLSATEVTVRQQQAPTIATMPFPADATARLTAIDGVVAAGAYWKVPLAAGTTVSAWPDGHSGQPLDVMAVAPGALAAAEAHLDAGRFYDQFAEAGTAKVAVISTAVATRLGITRLDAAPAVFVGDDAYTVVGTFTTTDRLPGLALDVLIPTQTALTRYGLPAPDNPATVLISTRVGAAQTVADQAPVALRPDDPTLLAAQAPPDPQTLKNAVGATTNALPLLLAGIALVIGAVGIANTTLVGVLERTGEVGLRRALGARSHHIAIQFLTEAALLGTAGGIVAMSGGTLLVLVVSLVHQWTAVIDTRIVFATPAVGAAIGAIAGAYPAWRAARIEPAAAIRQ